MTYTRTLRIGARGGMLAQAQAAQARQLLLTANPDRAVELVAITTTGDRIIDRPLSEVDGKGLFIKEIDEAVLRGDVDIAAHSLKDMPAALAAGLTMPCVLSREDARDAFISTKADSLEALPAGSVIGTASARRQAWIASRHPHLRVAVMRGNITTRLSKLDADEVDAIILAIAGLSRIHMGRRATKILSVDAMPPAIGQGTIALTCRRDDVAVRDCLAPLNHRPTHVRSCCERAFLRRLDGSCHMPIAGLAHLSADGARLSFRGLVMRPDGSQMLEAARVGVPEDAERLGTAAAVELLERMGSDFFAPVTAATMP